MQNQDYYYSDDINIDPNTYNDEIHKQSTNQLTITDQINFLKAQTELLKSSIELERKAETSDPLAYINYLESSLQSMQLKNLKQRIQTLALLCPSAEKELIIKYQLPDSAQLLRFQQLESKVSELEQIMGNKTHNFTSTITAELTEMSKSIENLKVMESFNQLKEPVVEKLDEIFAQVQLLMGIYDLLPNISERLEQLKQAHEQSINYNTRLENLKVKHQKIVDQLISNKERMKKICIAIEKKYTRI